MLAASCVAMPAAVGLKLDDEPCPRGVDGHRVPPCPGLAGDRIHHQRTLTAITQRSVCVCALGILVFINPC